MKKIFGFLTIISLTAAAQETVLPAPKQTGTTVITNATVHVGNGTVHNNASIVITDGKITAVGPNVTVPAGATTVNAQGKHVYPGLILPVSRIELGLGVRGGVPEGRPRSADRLGYLPRRPAQATGRGRHSVRRRW